MRKMNCRSVRREIEEVIPGNLLSASAHDHLKNCPECNAFREDRLKLQEMLSSLGAVEAPGDFDFRLRARLANEKRGAEPFMMRNLSFGFRSAAVAATLLLIGSAILFVGLRTTPNTPLAANGDKAPSTATEPPQKNGQQGSGPVSPVAISVPAKTDGIDITDAPGGSGEVKEKQPTPRQYSPRRIAPTQGTTAVNQTLSTRDQASTAAKVLRAWDATHAGNSNVFPIGASNQSFKVSLDDGRGSSRTISLPSVSFGSQRVLNPGSSSLMASARSDW